MAVGEIAVELIGVIGRIIVEIFRSAFFDLIIKGPGYFLASMFRRNTDPDGFLAILMGLVFWVFLGMALYLTYKAYGAAAA